MKTLQKYLLDRSRVLPYLEDNLVGTNRLCSEVFTHLASSLEGEFYTLLYKEKTPDDQLYQFTFGGVGGSIRDEISSIILEKLETIPLATCVFDDVNTTYLTPATDSVFSQIEVHDEKESYYVIQKDNLSKHLVDTCLYASNAIWHSLCVVSKATLAIRQDRSVTQGDIQSLVKNAQMILIGAYDD